MPGVLIVEAMAQAAGALVVHTLGLTSQNRIVYFMTIDKARFRDPVRPGEMLRIPVKALPPPRTRVEIRGRSLRRRQIVRGGGVQRHDPRRHRMRDENSSDGAD